SLRSGGPKSPQADGIRSAELVAQRLDDLPDQALEPVGPCCSVGDQDEVGRAGAAVAQRNLALGRWPTAWEDLGADLDLGRVPAGSLAVPEQRVALRLERLRLAGVVPAVGEAGDDAQAAAHALRAEPDRWPAGRDRRRVARGRAELVRRRVERDARRRAP